MVDYYIPKGCVIIENNPSYLRYVPLRLKRRTYAEVLHNNYFLTAWCREIPSTDNNLKGITICSGLYIEFAPIYYNGKLYTFRYILGGYIKPYIE